MVLSSHLPRYFPKVVTPVQCRYVYGPLFAEKDLKLTEIHRFKKMVDLPSACPPGSQEPIHFCNGSLNFSEKMDMKKVILTLCLLIYGSILYAHEIVFVTLAAGTDYKNAVEIGSPFPY